MTLTQAIKDIDQHLKNIIAKASAVSDVFGPGFCMLAARHGYEFLKKKEFDVQVNFGRAAFSVNKKKFGILCYGQFDYVTVYGEGRKMGHYWLSVEGKTIDFMLPYLEQCAAFIDRQSADKTGPIKVPTNSLVSKKLIKRKLMS